MMLQGKTAVITGASRGIGLSCAELFAENGSDLILISRTKSVLETVKADLESRFGVNVKVFATDVRDYEALNEIFKSVRKEKIPIHILINNAGIMQDATLQMTSLQMIQDMYETNVYGSMYCAKLATKSMLRLRKGSIINISSIIGTNGNLGQSIYGSSKSALIGFTKSLSKELASLNIRVNAIAPGFIDTEMTQGMDPKFYQKNLESIGMKRLGKPIDIAKVALFFASDLSEYVTGQTLGVDGSMII